MKKKARSASVIDQWRAQAEALPAAQTLNLAVPLDVFWGEAVDVAKFHAKYWKTQRDEDGEIILPGLELAVGKGQSKKALSGKTGNEIKSLRAAAREADTNYQFSVTRSAPAPMEESQQVLTKIHNALQWAFDDGIDDHYDDKLASLEARHGQPNTHDQMASALEAYADLADQARELLEGFETFDMDSIERARELAQAVVEAPSNPNEPSEASRSALDLRNRLCRLLQQRIALVRAAAGFVFQDFPELRREVSSTYGRRQRAAVRRREREAEANEAAQGGSAAGESES